MTRRPKDIGTAAESAVVKVLRKHGFPHAERRALHGSIDLGDITGTPGLAWEVKGGTTAKTASDSLIHGWVVEASVEAANARAEYGFLIVQRAQQNPRNWWACVFAGDLARMLGAPEETHPAVPVRMRLVDLCHLLRITGWADTKGQP